MKAPSAEQTETSVLAAYQSLVDQGAEPGKVTRERAQAIVSTWQASLAPTPPAPTPSTTRTGSPELPAITTRDIRQIFLFGAGVGALATLLLVAVVFAVVLGSRS
jgi:hypothetical protein